MSSYLPPHIGEVLVGAVIAMVIGSAVAESARGVRTAALASCRDIAKGWHYLGAVISGSFIVAGLLWPLIQFGPSDTVAVLHAWCQATFFGWVAVLAFVLGIVSVVSMPVVMYSIARHPARMARRMGYRSESKPRSSQAVHPAIVPPLFS